MLAALRADVRRLARGGVDQCRVRIDRRLGSGALRFPGRRMFDAMVDLPFALPTAVAGISLSALYAPNGWIGAALAPLGIKVAYHALGHPGRADLRRSAVRGANHSAGARGSRRELEEAAATLGATRAQTFCG